MVTIKDTYKIERHKEHTSVSFKQREDKTLIKHGTVMRGFHLKIPLFYTDNQKTY